MVRERGEKRGRVVRSKEERKEEVKELLRRINQSGMELNLLQEKEREIEEVEEKFVGWNDKEFDSMVEAQYVIRKRMFGVLSMRNMRVRQLTRKVGDLKRLPKTIGKNSFFFTNYEKKKGKRK